LTGKGVYSLIIAATIVAVVAGMAFYSMSFTDEAKASNYAQHIPQVKKSLINYQYMLDKAASDALTDYLYDKVTSPAQCNGDPVLDDGAKAEIIRYFTGVQELIATRAPYENRDASGEVCFHTLENADITIHGTDYDTGFSSASRNSALISIPSMTCMKTLTSEFDATYTKNDVAFDKVLKWEWRENYMVASALNPYNCCLITSKDLHSGLEEELVYRCWQGTTEVDVSDPVEEEEEEEGDDGGDGGPPFGGEGPLKKWDG